MLRAVHVVVAEHVVAVVCGEAATVELFCSQWGWHGRGGGERVGQSIASGMSAIQKSVLDVPSSSQSRKRSSTRVVLLQTAVRAL